MSTASSGGQRVDPACRIEELAKAPGLAVPERPDVDERHVEALPGLLRDAAVAAEDDDLVTRLEELVRLGGELRPPVPIERVEDVRAHLRKTVVGAAVRQ